MAKSKINGDIIGQIIKTPDNENDQIQEVKEELLNLTKMTDKLAKRREEFMVESKIKDIKYVRALDKLIKTVLDGLTAAVEDEEILKQAVSDTIRDGKFKALKELMVSFGIIMEKRELLLGFDETRVKTAADKKRMKLKVAWQGANGEQNAVQVET